MSSRAIPASSPRQAASRPPPGSAPEMDQSMASTVSTAAIAVRAGGTAVLLAIDEGPKALAIMAPRAIGKARGNSEAPAAPKNVHRRVKPNQFHS
jgi:hypothetical protein